VVVSNTLQPKRTSIKGYGMGLAMLERHYRLMGNKGMEVVKSETEFKVYLPLL
jgi:hypothetical protein